MASGTQHPLDALKNYAIKTFEDIAAAAVIRPIIQPIIANALGGLITPTSTGVGGSTLSTVSGVAGLGAAAYTLGGGATGVYGGIGSNVANYINQFGYTNFGIGSQVGTFGGAIDPATGQFVYSSGTAIQGGLSSILGGAGIGALGGYLVSSLFGGNKTVGSVGGAASGALFAAGDPVLGGIAAALTLLGSLFGPGISNKTGVSNLDLLSGTYTSGPGNPNKDSPTNDQAAGQLASTLAQFETFLTGEAGTTISGRAFFEVGDRDGITANVNGAAATFDNSDSGAAQAICFAVKQVASELGDKLPKEISDALNAVDFSSTASVTNALTQLQTVKSFLDLQTQIAQLSTPIDQQQSTYTTTLTQIQELASQVQQLGISADEANSR